MFDTRKDVSSELFVAFCKKICSKLKFEPNKQNFVYLDEMGLYIGKKLKAFQKGYIQYGVSLEKSPSFLENGRIRYNILGCLQNGLPKSFQTYL